MPTASNQAVVLDIYLKSCLFRKIDPVASASFSGQSQQYKLEHSYTLSLLIFLYLNRIVPISFMRWWLHHLSIFHVNIFWNSATNYKAKGSRSFGSNSTFSLPKKSQLQYRGCLLIMRYVCIEVNGVKGDICCQLPSAVF